MPVIRFDRYSPLYSSIFFFILAFISKPTLGSQPTVECPYLLKHFENILFDVPSKNTLKTAGKSAAFIESEINHYLRLSGNRSLKNIPPVEELIQYRLIYNDPFSAEASVETLKILTPRGKELNVDVPINSRMRKIRSVFDRLEAGLGFRIPKEAQVEHHPYLDLYESVLAWKLTQLNLSELKKAQTYLQEALFTIELARRKQAVLMGKSVLNRMSDFTSSPYPLSWRKLSARLGLQGKDARAFDGYDYGPIHAILAWDETRLGKVSEEKAFDTFLSDIFYHYQWRNQISESGGQYGNPPIARSLYLRSETRRELGFHYIDTERMLEIQSNRKLGKIPPQFENLPSDIRSYIFLKYSEELNLPEEQLLRLIDISRQVSRRTDYVVITAEGFAKLKPKKGPKWDIHTQSWVEKTWDEQEDFEHFTIKGAMSLVRSKRIQDKLLTELFRGKMFPRKQGERVVEIGRFSVDSDLRPLGPKQIWKTVALLFSKGDVDKVFAYTSKEYAEELIKKFGFKKIDEELLNGHTYYYIQADPETFFDNAVVSSLKN